MHVTNIRYRNYLYAYEDLRFASEVYSVYLIDYVDEIAQETAMGYYDLLRFLGEFYDADKEMIEEDFPSVYHWDEEQPSVMGVIFPYAYHDIF